jgi:hypothetical protein
VVLVGQWRSEESHDPVAHDLIDGALIAVHRLHHAFKHRVEEFPRFLWIAVGERFHGALEIREEDRHLFALALQSNPRGKDLFGQVLGGVNLGRTGHRR